ncbi:MAG: hypothetical protein CMH57_06345 [Myxococcales bacterium]|nr:hypothetical protein [Myxococcales bacterium]
MKEQTIIIEIDGEGRLTADAEGFSGDACVKELEKLLDGLGQWESVERKEDADDRTVGRRRRNRLGLGRKP